MPPYRLPHNLVTDTDLDWFMQRYPLDISEPDRVSMEGGRRVVPPAAGGDGTHPDAGLRPRRWCPTPRRAATPALPVAGHRGSPSPRETAARRRGRPRQDVHRRRVHGDRTELATRRRGLRRPHAAAVEGEDRGVHPSPRPPHQEGQSLRPAARPTFTFTESARSPGGRTSSPQGSSSPSPTTSRSRCARAPAPPRGRPARCSRRTRPIISG